jgi:hypothetical protein
MRAFGALLLAAVVAVGLTQSLAQGAPAAKKTAKIPVPTDANAAVAHLVLTAKPKKGKKPKRAVKRPKLKVKAPKGVVVAASYKRDAKNKNKWHATVALTNPVGGPLSRRAAAAGQDDAILVTVIETDTEFIVVIEGVQIDGDVVFVADPSVPPWMLPYCDGPGFGGDMYLFGMQPGVPPTEFLDYACVLGQDGPTTGEPFMELGLGGIAFDGSPFPGNPNEIYLDFWLVNIEQLPPPGPRSVSFTNGRAVATAGANGVSFNFPGRTVTAQLPPQGFGGVITPGAVTWGNKNVPFTSGQMYRGNVRLSSPLTTKDVITGRYTVSGGPPYSKLYTGRFTP